MMRSDSTARALRHTCRNSRCKKMVLSHQHIPLRCHNLPIRHRIRRSTRRPSTQDQSETPHLTPRHPRPHRTDPHRPSTPSRDAQNQSTTSKSCAGAAFYCPSHAVFPCAGAHLATRAHHPRSASRVCRGSTNICADRTRAAPCMQVYKD